MKNQTRNKLLKIVILLITLSLSFTTLSLEALMDKDVGVIKTEYVDQNGNKLKDDLIETDDIGKSYFIQSEEIEDHRLISESEVFAEFSDNETIISFVYERILTDDISECEAAGLYIPIDNSEEIAIHHTCRPDGTFIPKGEIHVLSVESFEYYNADIPAAAGIGDLFYTVDTVINTRIEYADYGTLYMVSNDEPIPGYDRYQTPNNSVGMMMFDGTTVLYGFKALDINIITNYIDTDNKVIADKKVESQKFNAEYKTERKYIDGYRLTELPENHEGIVDNASGIVVNYVYEKGIEVIEGIVNVNYVTTDGTPLAESIQLSGEVGTDYTTEELIFDGYVLTETPSNSTGTFSPNVEEVIYVYEESTQYFEGYVNVEYVTTDGTPLTDSILIAGEIGTEYTTEELVFDGYVLTEVPSNSTGTFSPNVEDVIYVYEEVKDKSSTITVKHLIKDTETELFDTELITNVVGESYNATSKSKEGYELVDTIGSPTGVHTEEDQDVIFVYDLMETTITVKHLLSGTNDEIIDTVYITNVFGKPFVASPMINSGYRLVNTTGSPNGTHTEVNQEVIFEYLPIQSTVTVKHLISGTTTELFDTETITNIFGEAYTARPGIKEGYELVNTIGSPTGVHTEEDQEVIFEYALIETTITVKHLISGTETELFKTEFITNTFGEDYTAIPKTKVGYELVNTIGSATGIHTKEDQEVTFEYDLIETKITVKHLISGTTTELFDTEFITNTFGEDYTANSKTKEGYKLVNTIGSPTGVHTEVNQEVTFEYDLIETKITVKHLISGTTTELFDTEFITNTFGEDYTANSKTKEGYKLVNTIGSPTGVHTEVNQEVTFEYDLIETKITVKHLISGTTTQLFDTEYITNTFGAAYTASPGIKTGYKLVKTNGNPTGTHTEVNQEVIFEYLPIQSTVTVKHLISGTTTELFDTETITNIFGESYTARPGIKEGYELVDTIGSPMGVHTEADQEVIFEYALIETKITVRHLISGTDTELFNTEYITNTFGEDYTAIPKTKVGYELVNTIGSATGIHTKEDQEVTFEYDLIETKITVKHLVSGTTTELFDTEFITNTFGEDYTAVAKSKEGYKLVKTTGNPTGTHTEANQEVIFEYALVETIITVKHLISGTDTELFDTEYIKNTFGEDYTALPGVKTGYKLVDTIGSPSGTHTEANQEVIFEYALIETTITVKHLISGTDTELFDTELITNTFGADYTARPGIKDGYKLFNTIGTPMGVHTEENQEVIFEYDLIKTTITVKHLISGTTTELFDTEFIINTFGEAYNAVAKIQEGYKLVKTTGNPTGTHTEANQEVIFEYALVETTITVRHLISGTTTELFDTEFITNPFGETYNALPGVKIGYKLVNTIGSPTGVHTEEDQEVIFEYDLIKTTITVKHLISGTTTELFDTEFITNTFGEDYTAVVKTKEGYELVNTTGSPTGVHTDEDQEVTFEYDLIETKITVKHLVSGTTTELFDTEFIENTFGEAYNAVSKTQKGYKLVNTIGSPTGVHTEEDQEVTFEYDLIETKITVKHLVSGTTTELFDTEFIENTFGEAYNAVSKTQKGYKLVNTIGSPTGVHTEEDQEVIFEYDLIKTTITVKHLISGTTTELFDTEYITNTFGTAYTVSPGIKTGYKLVNTIGSPTGVHTEVNQEVTFEYDLIETKITVKHLISGTTTELFDTETITNIFGEDYTANSKTKEGYKLVNTIGSPSGTHTEENQEVIFEYALIETIITVKHLISGTTTELFDTEYITNTFGAAYTVSPGIKTGYKLVETTGNPMGTHTEENQEVIFEYALIESTITVRYLLKDAKTELFKTEFITNCFGESYNAVAKTKEGYRLVNTIGTINGVHTEENQDVIFEYEIIESTITIKHLLSGTDTELFDTETITNVFGETYTARPGIKEGYTVVKTTGNPTGIHTGEDQEVIFEYDLIKTTITVKHLISGTQTELLESETITNIYGESYIAVPKLKEGYELVNTIGEAVGVHTDVNQEVIFEYDLFESIIKVEYVEEHSKTPLSSPVYIVGVYGDEYNCEYQNIEGYSLVSIVGSPSGTHTEQRQTVAFEYESIESTVTVKHVLSGTDELLFDTETITNTIGEAYHVLPKTKEGYKLVNTIGSREGVHIEEDLEIIFEYALIESTLTIEYIEKDTEKNIMPVETITKTYGTEYHIEPLDLDGYVLLSVIGKTKGVYTEDDMTVTFVYEALDDGENPDEEEEVEGEKPDGEEELEVEIPDPDEEVEIEKPKDKENPKDKETTELTEDVDEALPESASENGAVNTGIESSVVSMMILLLSGMFILVVSKMKWFEI